MPNRLPLRLYPRGFLGADLTPQIKRTPDMVGQGMKERFQYHTETVKGTGKEAHATTNSHIESLYSQYIKRAGNSTSFEFHAEVLHASMVAFGTKDFSLWFQAQFKSPACGDLHRRFLDDTLRFINTGRREMSLETWASLIVITDEGDTIGPISAYAKDFFGVGKGIGHTAQSGQNYSLTDVLQQWCSKPNGFADLLGTMHILFGSA